MFIHSRRRLPTTARSDCWEEKPGRESMVTTPRVCAVQLAGERFVLKLTPDAASLLWENPCPEFKRRRPRRMPATGDTPDHRILVPVHGWPSRHFYLEGTVSDLSPAPWYRQPSARRGPRRFGNCCADPAQFRRCWTYRAQQGLAHVLRSVTRTSCGRSGALAEFNSPVPDGAHSPRCAAARRGRSANRTQVPASASHGIGRRGAL